MAVLDLHGMEYNISLFYLCSFKSRMHVKLKATDSSPLGKLKLPKQQDSKVLHLKKKTCLSQNLLSQILLNPSRSQLSVWRRKPSVWWWKARMRRSLLQEELWDAARVSLTASFTALLLCVFHTFAPERRNRRRPAVLQTHVYQVGSII